MDNNFNGFTPNNGGDLQQNLPNAANEATQMQANAQPVADFANQAAQETFNNDGSVAVAKKKSKLPFIIGGSVLGLAGVGALLFAFVAPVKNWVKITFMKPEKYFASVEEQAFSGYASDIAEGYGQIVNAVTSEDGSTVNYGVEMTFGEEFINLVMEEAAAEGAEIPEFTLESIGADISLGGDTEIGGASAAVTLNGENAISVNAVYDIAEQMFYLQVPELSEAYLTASIAEYMEQMTGETGLDLSTLEFDTDVLVSEEEMKAIIEDYANIVYSSIDAVEIEKGEEVKIAGEEYSFNVMEFELSGDELIDIVVDVLEAAAEEDAFADIYDELIRCYEESGAMDYLESEEGMDSSMFEMSYEELVEGLADTLSEVEIEADIEIVGRVYVDARGVVMGREYTIEAGGEEATFYYIIGADSEDEFTIEALIEVAGEEIATLEFARVESEFEGNITVEGEEIVTVSGDYKDGAYSGSLTLITPAGEYEEEYDYYYEDEEEEDEDEDEASSEELVIGFDNLKTVGENGEFLSGSIYIENQDSVDFDELEEYGVEKLSLVFESDGKGQDVSFVIGDLISLTVSASTEEGTDLEIPEDADTYDIETELEAYLETVDYEGVVTNILELLGLDDDFTTEEIISGIEQSIAGADVGYDDSWDDEDWDDEDWDDEDWDDEDWDDDYDDDYVSYDYDSEYIDFIETVEVNAFGQTYSWPMTAEAFCAYFGLDGKITTVAYDEDWVFSDEGSELDFYNPFAYDVDTQDCFVDYLYVSGDDDGLLVTVNGVGIGSSIDDINDAFGTYFNGTYGEVEIEDNYYYDSVTFHLEDDEVTSFTLYGDCDYVYDNIEDYETEGTEPEEEENTEEDEDETYYDEYDYEYVSFSNNAVISVFGFEGTWPCKAEVFCEYFGLDPDMMVEPYGYDYIFNDLGSEIDYYNPFGDEIRLGDCYIDYIYVNPDDTDFAIAVNGVGVGATLEDINAAFDTEFAVMNGSVEVEDSYYYDSVIYYLEDGVVVSFSVYGDDDAVLDNLSGSSDEEEESDFENSFGTGTVIE